MLLQYAKMKTKKSYHRSLEIWKGLKSPGDEPLALYLNTPKSMQKLLKCVFAWVQLYSLNEYRAFWKSVCKWQYLTIKVAKYWQSWSNFSLAFIFDVFVLCRTKDNWMTASPYLIWYFQETHSTMCFRRCSLSTMTNATGEGSWLGEDKTGSGSHVGRLRPVLF